MGKEVVLMKLFTLCSCCKISKTHTFHVLNIICVSVIQKENSRELTGGGEGFKHITSPVFIITVFILQVF